MRAFLPAVCLAIVAVLAASAPTAAGTDDIAFPSGYADAFSKYATVDKPHPERGPSIRDIYINPVGLAAAKAGTPLPSGTVIVMEVHRARQDAAKQPLPGAGGRFEKDKLSALFIMEKRTGWGAGYPAAQRNGEWEYARFEPDGTRHKDPGMGACFVCHKARAATDFLFSVKELNAFTAK